MHVEFMCGRQAFADDTATGDPCALSPLAWASSASCHTRRKSLGLICFLPHPAQEKQSKLWHVNRCGHLSPAGACRLAGWWWQQAAAAAGVLEPALSEAERHYHASELSRLPRRCELGRGEWHAAGARFRYICR
jgi:hypothetical protein